MSDIKSMGFTEDGTLNIDDIFGAGVTDAELPPMMETDISAGMTPDSEETVPVTDNAPVSVHAETENKDPVPDTETAESPVQTETDSADTNSPEGKADASTNEKTATNTEFQENSETSQTTRRNARKKAVKSAGKQEGAQETEMNLFAAFSNSDADAPLFTTEAETSADDSQSQSLFDKPPVFSYGGVKEKIEDSSQTFEELRILKADDFPELGEGKSVTWKVKYGSVTKSVADPKDATVASDKEEIEKSKAFLDGLTKAKDKNPDCLVVPSVTAKSKGISSYKGVFPTLEEARKSGKVICLIPARDGNTYEFRKTEMGEMVVPKRNIAEFAEVCAGFIPVLPRIPREVTGQIISFFRSFMNGDTEYEALVFVYWDRQNEEFVVFVPKQRVGRVSVYANLTDNCLPEERYLHYADIHSHNSMEAEFSSVDDRDEKATRLYIVLGRLNGFYPSVSARISCGGTYLPIDPELVMEGVGEEFPTEWLNQVERIPARKAAPEDAEQPPVRGCLGQIVLRVTPRELMEEP